MVKKSLKKETEGIAVEGDVETVLNPEDAIKLQTHCAKCGANLAQTGYVENNYKRFCGPACAA